MRVARLHLFESRLVTSREQLYVLLLNLVVCKKKIFCFDFSSKYHRNFISKRFSIEYTGTLFSS